MIALATVVTFILRLRAVRAADSTRSAPPDEIQPLPPLRTQLLSDVDSAADTQRARTRVGAYDVELNDAAAEAARPQGASMAAAEEEAPVEPNKVNVEPDDL